MNIIFILLLTKCFTQEFEQQLGWPLYEAVGHRRADGDCIEGECHAYQAYWWYVIGACVLIVLISAVAYVLKKRKVTAMLWNPPPGEWKGGCCFFIIFDF